MGILYKFSLIVLGIPKLIHTLTRKIIDADCLDAIVIAVWSFYAVISILIACWPFESVSKACMVIIGASVASFFIIAIISSVLNGLLLGLFKITEHADYLFDKYLQKVRDSKEKQAKKANGKRSKIKNTKQSQKQAKDNSAGGMAAGDKTEVGLQYFINKDTKQYASVKFYR